MGVCRIRLEINRYVFRHAKNRSQELLLLNFYHHVGYRKFPSTFLSREKRETWAKLTEGRGWIEDVSFLLHFIFWKPHA